MIVGVAKVKNHIHGLIQDPITVSPEQVIGDVIAMMDQKDYSFSTFPVVDAAGNLVGLLAGRVVKARCHVYVPNISTTIYKIIDKPKWR